MFFVKPMFSRHFRKILVTTPSAEMNKGNIDTLLRLEIFLFSRAMFSRFVIFPASALGRVWVKGTAISIASAVLLYLSISTILLLLSLL